MENEKKLTRSSNRMIAGVCAGIAEYFVRHDNPQDNIDDYTSESCEECG